MGDGRLGQAEWLSQVADARLAAFVRSNEILGTHSKAGRRSARADGETWVILISDGHELPIGAGHKNEQASATPGANFRCPYYRPVERCGSPANHFEAVKYPKSVAVVVHCKYQHCPGQAEQCREEEEHRAIEEVVLPQGDP